MEVRIYKIDGSDRTLKEVTSFHYDEGKNLVVLDSRVGQLTFKSKELKSFQVDVV